MAVEIGVATDYLDLQTRLKLFLTTNADLVADGHNWELQYENGTELHFRGPGLSGTENIFVQMQTYENLTGLQFNWRFKGSGGYTVGNTYGNHPYTSLDDAYVALWNMETPYWFIANGQRFIVVAKVNGSYRSCYMGKIFPYATPNQYPMPLFIGGEYDAPLAYTSTSGVHFVRSNTYECNGWLFTPYNIWIGYDNEVVSNNDMRSFPYDEYLYANEEWLNNVVPLPTGETVIMPIVLFSNEESSDTNLGHNIFGEFDGVYWTPGLNQTSESIITVDGVNYLMVQDIYNAGARSFKAIRLE